MNKRIRRKKSKKNLLDNPVLEKKTRGPGARKGLNMKIGSDGSMHIRHMSNEDRCLAILPGIPFAETEEAVTMSLDSTPKWNKLAVHGTFKGHPTGPFELDAKVFSQIETNFKKFKLDVPFDYEHASEISVTDSPAKARGEVKASGWIKDIQARDDGLYGLVDWTDEARQKINSKEIKYISPAIRFGAKDPKTGEGIGAKLSSAALCLKPFLSDLPQALAADSEYTAFLCSEISPEEVVSLTSASTYAITPNEYLPRFRRILNLDDLASADVMLDKVERLEELCELAEGDGTAIVEGVNLSNYIVPLRDFMRMPANTTLSELLDATAQMIEDSQGVEMSDIPSVAAQEQTTPTAPVITTKEIEPVMETITLTEHALKVSEAVTSAVSTATAPLTLQLTDAKASAAQALADKATAEAKIVELTEQIKKRDADLVTSRVEEAFETYKETKKLSEDDKAAMPIVLATNPELFNKLYPKVPAAKAAVMRTVLSTDTSAGNRGGSPKIVPPFAEIIADVQSKNPTKDYDTCFTMALKEQATLMAG